MGQDAPMATRTTALGLRTGTAAGRWVIATAVLGSGVAFLDGTVVNAALPSIAKDLHADLADLQWVITGYLLTLGALLVIGGSLGDLFGRRRIFVFGLLGFGTASLLCGVAPTTETLIAARCVQGVAAALLVPGSLAIISASFREEDRAAAIGAWSGLGGIATAFGPFLGGWLIDAVSWRLVFLINLPLIALAVTLAIHHVPESSDPEGDHHVDVLGGALLGFGLAGVVYALIEGPNTEWSATTVVIGVVGAVLLTLFFAWETRAPHPMVPLTVFRSRQFSGANAATFGVYAALSGAMFFVIVYLQTALGYSAVEAGASFVPITLFMLAFSARSGALAQRIGPRLQMTVGPLVAGIGIALFSLAEPGVSYWEGVLPGAVVLGMGLTITVAPLTAAVLAAIDDRHAGVGSAINNAVARLAGLLAIAVLPVAAGIASAHGGLDLRDGFDRAMFIAGGLCASGGVVSFLTIRTVAPVRTFTRADVTAPCEHPCLAEAS
jgi:EmrB/QacA subfamily drug resistance transporter